ncbi:pilus assembly protein [Xylophilus sp. GOD-11R]|uniref:pilus assembly protein n=1 Tax=Xylophilus sp. GOD-11R TaxID=3089814 RepID=UPI00298C55CA|nr:PilC/PilY family type IV pilus protein [Xylophilus sp. GOD-11R]WPB59304.1 PilC/PilY family type IV pilus protein [Xylophilus sp. GOD-11R]
MKAVFVLPVALVLAWLVTTPAMAMDLAQSPDDKSPPSQAMSPMVLVEQADGSLARMVFTTSYDAADWSGRVLAFPVDAAGVLAKASTWRSDNGLDAAAFDPAKRLVLSHDGNTGIALRWSALSAAQQAGLTAGDNEADGRQRLDHARGDHRAEAVQGGALRSRLKIVVGKPTTTPFRQADIVHSQPWFVPAHRVAAATNGPSMVYVGGNDGMLHGFDALTGEERLAYVPGAIVSRLVELTRPAYRHRYFVDGPIFVGKAAGARVLVGSPGAGAKGYFVLDVHRPALFSEASAASTVLVDTTSTADADIGHLVSEPSVDAAGTGARQIVKLNDDRWAVVLGNGIGSDSGMPVLLLQYLDGSRELRRLKPSCPAMPAKCVYRGENGLATPLLMDANADGKADIAYAGDLLGHVWKFDLTSSKPDAWHVAFQGKPLFTARDAAGRHQAFTSAPEWLPHPAGGVMLAIGSGRQLTEDDRTDRQVQTIYGLHDAATLPEGQPVNEPDKPGARRDVLVQQSVLEGDLALGTDRFYRTSASSGDDQALKDVRGWFLDLPDSGERILHAPRPFAGSKMMFFSESPSGEKLTVLDLTTGKPSASPVFAALVGNGAAIAKGATTSSRVSLGGTGRMAVQRGGGIALVSLSGGATLALLKGQGAGVRPSWRRLP